MLGTSTRTIFREIQGVDKILEKYGCVLETKMGKGIKLNGNIEKIAEKLDDYKCDAQRSLYYTKEQRREVLTADGLKNAEFQKLGYYAYKFGTSEATISNDISTLETWFEEHKLKLIKENGKVVTVQGDEKDIRDAIIEFFGKVIIRRDEIEHKENTYKFNAFSILQRDERIIDAFVSKEVLFKVVGILESFGDIVENLTASSYVELIICIAVVVDRVQKDKKIILEDEMLSNLQTDPTYEKIRKMLEYIEREFHVQLNRAERGYLCMRLKGLRRQFIERKRKGLSKYVTTEYEPFVLAEDMIKIFGIIANIDLTKDKILKEGLLAHIIPSLDRACYSIHIQNPLLNEMRTQYKETFKSCEECCNIIFSKYGIIFNEDEIGFLTFHFQAAMERKEADIGRKVKVNVGCVCPEGIGLGGLLAARISNAFSDYVKVYTVSLDQIEKGEIQGIDVLVTTIGIPKEEIPIIFVSPLLLKEDVSRLSEILEKIRNKKFETVNYEEKIETGNIDIILDGIKIVTADGSHDKETVIGELLEMQGIIGERAELLKKAILKRESIGQVVLKEKAFILFHCAVEMDTDPIILFFNLDFRKGVSQDFEGYKTGAVIIVDRNRNKTERNLIASITAGFIYEPQIIDEISYKDEERLIYLIKNHLKQLL